MDAKWDGFFRDCKIRSKTEDINLNGWSDGAKIFSNCGMFELPISEFLQDWFSENAPGFWCETLGGGEALLVYRERPIPSA